MPVNRRSVSTSTMIVTIAAALSSILGFGLQVVLAHLYGTRPEMDAFLNASVIPVVVFGIINGALVSSLVPTLSEFVGAGRHDDVAKLGSTVINTLAIVMTLLAVAAALAAPRYVPFIARGFPPKEQQLVVEMVRWLMPGVVATSLSGVSTALLNATHRFLAPALVFVASNIVTVIFVVALHRQLGIFALVLGTVVGIYSQFLIQLPTLLHRGLYRFTIDLRHPGVSASLMLLVPIAIGSGAGQINLAFDRYFASTLDSGSTAALSYTTKLAFLPIQIVAAAIGTVMFPVIASQFASSELASMQKSISLALRVIGFLVIPCAAGLTVLAKPIIQVLFQRGAFGSDATALCASYIPFACIPLLATSFNSLLGRACYACREARMAVLSSVAAVVVNVMLSAAFLPILGGRGLLLANGISGSTLAALLFYLLWRLIGGLNWKPLVSSLLRVSLASSIMAIALHEILDLPIRFESTLLVQALRLFVLLLFGVALYVCASKILYVDELQLVMRAMRKKFTSTLTPAIRGSSH